MEAQLVGSDLLKEGWLTKEAVGKNGMWRQRYFVLKNNALYYYEEKPKSAKDKPKGIIELSSKSIIRPSAVQKNYAFEVFTKPILLRVHAANQMEAGQWMAVLKEAVENMKEADAARGGEREHKMEGFLVKRAMQSGRNWKKRWFVLKGGRIAYYEDRPKPGSNERPKGVMELTPDTTVLVFKDNQSVKPNTFEVTSKKLVLTVSADSLEQLKEWVAALDQQILAKAGITSQGAIEVCKWLRTLGLQEYAKRMIDQFGCDELASIWDMSEITSIGEALEMSRMEKDALEEAFRVLKKGKKPKSYKEQKKVPEKPKVATVLFDVNPPPPAATTRLFTWGDSSNGQLGLVQARTGAHCHTPTWVDALKNKSEPASVACGTAAMGCITKEGGNLYTWGSGPIGLGGDKMESARPFLVIALRDIPIKQLACGGAHMVCVSKDGEVFAWGAGDAGQLGMGERVQGAASPLLMQGVGPKDKTPIVSCSAGAEHTLLVSSQGLVYACGLADKGRLGLPSTDKVFYPTKVKSLEGHPIGQTACGDEFSLCVSKTGSAAFWFGNICDRTILAPERIARFTNRSISQCCAAAGTGMFLVGLSVDTITGEFGDDASVYSFGKDPLLHGHGDDEPKLVPTLIEGLEGHGVTQISISPSHAGCLTSDGRILMWGRDDCGQLGSSYMVSITRPAEVIKISGFKYTAVACGDGFSAAIAVEDTASLFQGIPIGNPCPPPPPPDEALRAVEAEGEDLQKLLDAFAVLSHKYDLENEEPPPPPDDDMDLDSMVPPPPPPPAEPKQAQPQKVGGKRILPPGSEDIGQGWLSHTDKASGRKYYEHPETGKVQWTAPF